MSKWVSVLERWPSVGDHKVKIMGQERTRYFDGSDIHKQVWTEAGVEWLDESPEIKMEDVPDEVQQKNRFQFFFLV